MTERDKLAALLREKRDEESRVLNWDELGNRVGGDLPPSREAEYERQINAIAESLQRKKEGR